MGRSRRVRQRDTDTDYGGPYNHCYIALCWESVSFYPRYGCERLTIFAVVSKIQAHDAWSSAENEQMRGML